MKILVTGGAGYVGCPLVERLLAAGHEVRVLDPLLYGGDGLLPFFLKSGFELLKGSVTESHDVREAVRGVDSVIHLAAIVGFPACRKHHDLARDVNVEGTRELIKAVPDDLPIVYASTGSNYGAVDGICTEESPVSPLSHYAITKCEAEDMLLDRGAVALRFATAFGLSPRLRLDLLINDFAFQAMKRRTLVVYEKHHMRTFIHVRDMARAFLLAAEQYDEMEKSPVYNVGTSNCTKEAVCEMLRARLDFFLHYAEIGSDADARNYEVSYEKIRSWGFVPQIDIGAGVDELCRGLEAIDIRNPYSNV